MECARHGDTTSRSVAGRNSNAKHWRQTVRRAVCRGVPQLRYGHLTRGLATARQDDNGTASRIREGN